MRKAVACFFRGWTGMILLCLLSACGTVYHQKDQERIAGLYYSNQLKQAQEESGRISDEEQEETDGNALLWHMEAGAVAMEAGQYQDSLNYLRRAEKLLYLHDSQGQLRLHKPGQMTYSGFRSDRILLHMMKFFDYLSLDEFENALVELRRMRYSQYRFLLRDVSRDFMEYNRRNAGKEAAPYYMKKDVFDRKRNSEALGLTRVLADYQEYNSKRRPALSAMFHPLAFYLSTLGYYWDNDWEEAAVDLGYLYRMQPDNELLKRDYATVLDLQGEPRPAELASVKKWDHSLCDDMVVVIYADGRAPAWNSRSVSFQIPGQVPANWHYPVLEKQKALPAVNAVVSAGGRTFPLVPLTDMHAVFQDEYWQLTMPEMIQNMVNAVEAQTRAHESAKASLAAAIASPDYEGKAFAIAAARIAVEATKTANIDKRDWRRWATVPRRFLVMHLPIPPDRKVTLSVDGKTVQNITLKKETHRAVIYLRKLDRELVPHVWESAD